MNFILPESGNLDDIRSYLAANFENEIGSSSEKKHAWIKKQLSDCRYSRLNREEKGVVRKFLQKVSGFSRAQIAREISDYRREIAGSVRAESCELRCDSGRQPQNETPAPRAPRQAPVHSEKFPVKFEVSQIEQGTAVEVRVKNIASPQERGEAENCEPRTESRKTGSNRRDQGDQRERSESRSISAPSVLSFWKRIRWLVIVSSLITNLALIGMLLSMTIWEHAKIAAENELQAQQQINTDTNSDRPLHAAPAYEPQP